MDLTDNTLLILLIHSVSQSTFAYTRLHIKLQSWQLKRTPQDCINELII